jgi:hypothetical protein
VPSRFIKKIELGDLQINISDDFDGVLKDENDKSNGRQTEVLVRATFYVLNKLQLT